VSPTDADAITRVGLRERRKWVNNDSHWLDLSRLERAFSGV